MRPRLLDLFCGAGGAAMGYYSAGFDIVGVDVAPQSDYPFEFVQDDALRYAERHGRRFDAIHASPPCQRYCAPTQYNGNRASYPDYVGITRSMLRYVGKPWILENVPGAPMLDPTILCGTMFGLRVYRHRLFQSSAPIWAPAHPKHVARCSRNGVIPPPDGFFTVTGGKHSRAWMNTAQRAMGIEWMTTTKAVCEAIPPAYTEHAGRQLLASLPSGRVPISLRDARRLLFERFPSVA